jgi:DNA-directed RNA polymerase alpha subunit
MPQVRRSDADAFPSGLSRPALRALAAAGVHSVEDLARWHEAELAQLHGMGPKTLARLRDALAARGLSFR